MKKLFAIFAAVGLVSTVAPAKAVPQAPNMDMSWAVRVRELQPEVPQPGACVANALASQYYAYIRFLREHGYRGMVCTDYVASPCHSAPQLLVDYQSGQPEPTSEPSSTCADERRSK